MPRTIRVPYWDPAEHLIPRCHGYVPETHRIQFPKNVDSVNFGKILNPQVSPSSCLGCGVVCERVVGRGGGAPGVQGGSFRLRLKSLEDSCMGVGTGSNWGGCKDCVGSGRLLGLHLMLRD